MLLPPQVCLALQSLVSADTEPTAFVDGSGTWRVGLRGRISQSNLRSQRSGNG